MLYSYFGYWLDFNFKGSRLLQLEQKRLQAGGSNVKPIQATTKLNLLSSPFPLGHGGRRNEQLGADKLHASDVLGGQMDLAQQLTIWRDFQHLALTVQGRPQIAVDVDAVAVGLGRPVMMVEDALVGDAAVVKRVVVRVQRSRRRVREVHCLVIRRPADGVGDGDGLAHDFAAGGLALEEVEGSFGLQIQPHVRHGAQPEPTMRIDSPVIAPESLPVVGDVEARDVVVLARLAVQHGNAVLSPYEHIVARVDALNVGRHRHVRVELQRRQRLGALGEIHPVDALLFDVDEAQAVGGLFVVRALAQFAVQAEVRLLDLPLLDCVRRHFPSSLGSYLSITQVRIPGSNGVTSWCN